MLVPRVLGPRERELLDLVELVHADHPARVAPGRACLAAETGREGDVAERQLARLEDLAGVQARERDLGGAGEVEPVVSKLVDVRLVGGERAGADERALADEHGRQDGDEALRREPVEREPVEREREPGRVADPVAEAGARTSAPHAPCRSGRPRCARALRRAAAARRRDAPPRRRRRSRRRARPRGAGSGHGARARRARPRRSRTPPRPPSAPPSRCCSSASCSGDGLPFSFVVRAARRSAARARASARRPRAARRTPRRLPCAASAAR